MSIVASFSLYRCTLCNRFHFDDDETYEEHLVHVDDHGIVTRQRVNDKLLNVLGALATAVVVGFVGWVALRAIHFWPHVPAVDEPPAVTAMICLSCVWSVFVGYGPLTYGADPWGRNWKEWLRDQMPGVIGLIWWCVFIGALTQIPVPRFSGPSEAHFVRFVICFVLLDFHMLYMLLHFDPSAKAIAQAEAKKDRAAQALEAEVERATKAGVTLDAFTDFSRETEVLVREAKNVGPDTKDGLPHPVEESIAFFDHWNENGRLSKLNPRDAIQLKRDLESCVIDDAWGSPPLAKEGAEILCTIIDQKMDAGIPGWQALREKCAAIASKGNAVSPTDNITVGNCVGTLLSLWFVLTLKFRFDHDVTHLGWSEASAYGLKIVLALAVLSALLFGIFGVVKFIRFILLRALVLVVRIWRSAERIADDEQRKRSTAKQALAEMDGERGIQRRPKVLVADDAQDIADTLATILNQTGFNAFAVYSSTAEVERARDIRPDFIISDIMRPDALGGGIAAAIRIREFLPSCKILLYAGQTATAELLNSAIAQGHEFGFLAMPAHPQDMLAWLKNPQPRKDKITAEELQR